MPQTAVYQCDARSCKTMNRVMRMAHLCISLVRHWINTCGDLRRENQSAGTPADLFVHLVIT